MWGHEGLFGTMGATICAYELLIPSLSSSDALPAPAHTGAFEACAGDAARLRVRDVLAAWPFEGRWHLRAQFAPPGEGHVFLDLLDPAAPVPLLADGTASLRALPLDALVAGAPGPQRAPSEWAWGADDFAAWAAARRVAAAAAGSGAQREGAQREVGGAPEEPPAEEWRLEDGELREGGAAARGIGAAAGEAAEAASAAASAALNAAASAASNALGAMTSFFGRRG